MNRYMVKGAVYVGETGDDDINLRTDLSTFITEVWAGNVGDAEEKVIDAVHNDPAFVKEVHVSSCSEPTPLAENAPTLGYYAMDCTTCGELRICNDAGCCAGCDPETTNNTIN